MSDLPNPHTYKPYMTEVKGRRPFRKIHTSIGHAKNALLMYGSVYNTIRGGKLYDWNTDTNEWSLLYDIPENSPESKIPWRKSGENA
jgi:hypothetical protein